MGTRSSNRQKNPTIVPQESVPAPGGDSIKALMERINLIERVADVAWEKVKHDLTPEDLDVFTQMPPDLDGLKAVDRWVFLLENPAFIGIRKAVATTFAKAMKEWDYPQKLAELKTGFSALVEAPR